MKGRRLLAIIAVFSGMIISAACSRIASLPAGHPEPLAEGKVACSECHEDAVRGVLKPYASFDHSVSFIRSHRLYAQRDDRLCATCHQSSFCNDCHVNRVEIKPSLKYGERPDREFMHRGDYLTRHKIDGKLDPTGCYRCHGRMNNKQCVACHR
ncbi:cytochrome c3 family protein [Geobacter sp. DSM 9736]|uniref:cytochrome c3 family protein n=1 Tax=Geobacter sp. DSM 9736 TaxID=1277350 RepID=UPI000B504BD2|nr:cytochrome c3 family protein [Geobacter sp. DSM 9736]SNB46170.1 Doubled CXXCH motif (Paired_CXXCH_1) [Geobacter sp. DSM 9736]